ncbi:MAG TPA: hypothetical protein VJP89_22660 [Pyrinomonadaceae bacterium]|nr:hypothetical protein [Pyrinomonadaceae bacterium]
MKKSALQLLRTFPAAIVAALITATGVFGQTTTGNLDPTFGSGGTVRTDFSGNIDRANAVAIQPDGKIVAAGSSFSSAKTVEDFIVARYNANGTLDKRFGSNGKITTDFFRNVDQINALVIQPDGKIVVAGVAQLGGNGGTPRVFALARYTSEGRVDSSFGNGGSLTTSFGGTFAAAGAIMLQPDGKIVVAGTADFNPRVPNSGLDFALARYNANGSLDASFGDAGKVVFDFFGSFDQANAAVVQPDGKIIVVGSASYDSFNTDIGFALTRVNPDGSTDLAFGSGGKQITSFFDLGAKANGIVLQPDGRFVVAGTASDTATRPVATDFALARYNADGTLDTSFGIGGETAVPFADSATEQANALVLAPDGKIIVAGAAFKTFATPPDFAVRRYNSDGSIDSSFGSGGAITTDFANGTDHAQAVALQADGKIVAAGRAFRSNFDLSLARYRNDVTPTIDELPPTAPAGLAATATSSSTIDLSWSASADNVGVTGYEIFRDGGATAIAKTNGTSFSDKGLAADSTHSYVVLAFDEAGNRSALSNTASATTLSAPPQDVTPPTAPAGLTATIDGATINLSWSASTDDIGVTGYRVFRDNGATPIGTVTGTAFSDSGQLGTHTYTVAAVDAAGNQSGFSNMVIATVLPEERVELLNLTLNPARVVAPASSTGTVILSAPAPAGGVSVALRSNDTKKATVPASVTVPEGATSSTFVIKTLTGSLGGGDNKVTISATLNGTTRSATLSVVRP